MAGDWNGDGIDTIGVYRPSTLSFYLRNSNSGGPEDIIFQYGVPGNVPMTGDWNGDGVDTIGVFLDDHWMLRDSNSNGYHDYDFDYGVAGVLPIVGDWDANGTDTIGVVDTTSNPPWLTWMLRNSNTAG